MKLRALAATTASITTVMALTACSGNSSTHSMSSMSSMSTATSSTSDAMADMNMDGGPAPAGMKAATNATYKVGTKVALTADHMAGMNGAPATVTGAFTTTTYAVNYEPTTGGAMVKDHKWVVQEELQGAGNTRLPDGASVTITADHMPGMKGAKGTIASSTTQTVYMVDYTAHGMTMKNHKWVIESEMKPAS